MMAVAVYSLLVVGVLSQVGWDVTVFTGFGVDATATTEYAEDRLGTVFLRSQHGHDGKEFFVQANDPWILDPESNALILGAPYYRSQRMLYPVLAGGGGLFGPEAIVWMMVIVNVLAVGFGSWAVARFCLDSGGSTWLGAAFALNIGFVSVLFVSGAGLIAGALMFWGLAEMRRGRLKAGVTGFALAVLAREVMLVAVAGVAAWHWLNGRQRSAQLVFTIPIAVTVGWAAYVRYRLGWADSFGDGVQSFGLPFKGFVEAFDGWQVDVRVQMIAGITVMVLILLTLSRFRLSSTLLAWSTIGFAVLGVFLVREVWQAYWDSTRTMAPLITAFAISVFIKTEHPEGDLPRP